MTRASGHGDPMPPGPGARFGTDRALLERAVRRRWITLGAVAVLLTAAHFTDNAAAPPSALASSVVAAMLLNLFAASLLSTGRFTRGQVAAAAGFDALVGSIPVLFLGPGAAGAAFLLFVAVPYGLAPTRVRHAAVTAFATAYAGAGGVSLALLATPRQPISAIAPELFLGTTVVVAALVAATALPARQQRHLRHLREILEAAGRGQLRQRAQTVEPGEVAALADAVNRVLDYVGTLVDDLRAAAAHADKAAAALGDRLERARTAAQAAAHAADKLGDGLWGQRATAEDGTREAHAAAREAEELRSRTEVAEQDTRHLADVANLSRGSLARAHEAVISLSQSVKTAVATMDELTELAEWTHGIASSLPVLARQTRLLALNAAIEAARVEEKGEGLTAVAEEIRALARDTADLARDVSELAAGMRHATEGLAKAIHAADEQIGEAREAAEEARAALTGLHAAAATTGEVVALAGSASESQAGRMQTLASGLGQLAATTGGYARALETSRRSAADHLAALDGLGEVRDGLRQIAQHLETVLAPYDAHASSAESHGSTSSHA